MLIFLYIILALAIFFVFVDVVDINRFITREYNIESKKIDGDIKLVVLADMHNKQFGKENYKLINAIRDINPDAIICAGDMLTAKPGKDYTPALNLFTYLKDYPVYYGMGNHEYRMDIYRDKYGDKYDEYAKALSELGVHILYNASEKVSFGSTGVKSDICIQGLAIDKRFYKRFERCEMDAAYIESEIGKRDENLFDIMIAHNPEYFPAYAEYGSDLVLSGHVHGGIMRLPILGGVISPKLSLFPRFDGGLFDHKETKMVLSRGLGCHTLPLRIFNPGELVVVNLHPCQK